MATVKSKAKRKERKHVESGAAHIRSTFNNTIVTITDPTAIPSLGHPLADSDSKALVRAHHSQHRWQLNRLLRLQSIRECVPLTFSSKDRAQAVKLLFVHCRQQASKSAALRTSPQFRTMAAVLRNAEEYKDYPFAYHFGAARRRRRTFG